MTKVTFEIGDTYESHDDDYGHVYLTVSEMGQGEIYFECFEYGILVWDLDIASRYVDRGIWKKVQF